MGFKDLFVEKQEKEVYEDVTLYEDDYSDDTECTGEDEQEIEDVVYEIQGFEVKQSSEIFEQNYENHNGNNSIYKIDDFNKALPKDMTKSTRVSTLSGLVIVSKLDLTELKNDCTNRKNILQSYSKSFTAKVEEQTKNNESTIEELLSKVDDLRKENETLQVSCKQQEEIIENEIKNITDLNSLLGGNE